VSRSMDRSSWPYSQAPSNDRMPAKSAAYSALSVDNAIDPDKLYQMLHDPNPEAVQSLASANDQFITSVYDHSLAKLALARALGVAHTSYNQYLGGR